MAVEIIYYKNGDVEEKIWNADSFKESSNLIGNLRSRPKARKNKWKSLGIKKIVYKIDS